ncbi:mitochondrial sodium/calcium exchanger protein-like [Colletes gigas]|uniref:mitochondrial sodium/calcium exchanger protein-like n=1 Tax=Colletes gigas TaxID=935657 RepID=UPI001C9A7AF6|nr:mitochondrial sodium/calcium exchanger protein-like [Colletes gigas]
MALFSFGLILMILWLLYLFLILGTTADNFFCPSLAVIANVMRLSENIAGVTILAFGNGAPDIFTSIVSGSEEGIIMFTELIGAGVFVTAIIAGSIAVAKPFRANLKFLMRDACFYILSVCWISYVVRDETIHLWEACSFVLCYALFIAVVVIMQTYDNREASLKNIAIATELKRANVRNNLGSAEEVEETEDTDRPKGLYREFLYDVNPIDEGDWTSANWIFKIILIIRAPVMFLLQLFIPLVNPTAAKNGWSKLLNCFQLCVTPTLALFLLNVWHRHIGPVPILPIFLVLGTAIGVTVFLITHVDRVPKYHNVFAFAGFLAAMLTVYLIAGEVMAVLQCVGYAFSISDAMLGITFLAWGNSVGDMISNIAIARQGFPRMGYAACFGGPMFNTLLGLGLTYGIAAGRQPDKRTNMRISDMAPGCFAFLLCSLLATIIYLNITGAVVRKSYGYLLYSVGEEGAMLDQERGISWENNVAWFSE